MEEIDIETSVAEMKCRNRMRKVILTDQHSRGAVKRS